MPRGYQCVVLAAFGWLSLTGADSADQPLKKSEPTTKAKPDKAPAEPIPVRIVGDYYAAFPDVKDRACYNATNHDSADLCAQWRAAIAAEKAADATQLADYIAGGGAILSFFSIALLIFTLRQGQSANRIAARQNRAWLEISDISLSGIQFERQSEIVNAYGYVSYKLTNHGETVAGGCVVRCYLWYMPVSPPVDPPVPDEMTAAMKSTVAYTLKANFERGMQDEVIYPKAELQRRVLASTATDFRPTKTKAIIGEETVLWIQGILIARYTISSGERCITARHIHVGAPVDIRTAQKMLDTTPNVIPESYLHASGLGDRAT